MSDELLSPLRRFKAHTERLLELAQRGDWEAFESAAAEREALIAPLNDKDFIMEVAHQELEQSFKKEVAEIQAMNDVITSLAEDAKSDLGDQLRQHTTQKQAIKAYRP